MPRRLPLAALVAAALLAAPAARGQSAAPPADPTANLVSELVVNARAPGPAWWRVSRGEAVVFVLGVPEFAPKAFAFDDALLRKRLDGADRLILAPQPRIGPLAMLGLLTHLKRLQQKPPLSQAVRAATAARLHAVLAARGDPPGEMDDLKPAFAGFVLSNSDGGRHGRGVSIHLGEIEDRVEALARSPALKARPRIVSTGGYDVLRQIEALGELPAAAQLACLDDGLRVAETGQGSVTDVARNWAAGRVRQILEADRGFEACLSASPDGSRDVRRRMSASVDAIADALRKPGLSVAVVDLRPLLAQGGVLDQLRRQGYEVHAPGE